MKASLTEQSKKSLLRSKKQKTGIVMESMRIMKVQVADWTLTRDEEESMMIEKVMGKLKPMQTDPEDQDEPAGAVDGQHDDGQHDEDDSCKPEPEEQIDQPKLTPKKDKRKPKKMTPIRKTVMKKAAGKMTPKMTQMTQMLMIEKSKKFEPPNVKLMAANINLRQSLNLPNARVHGKMKSISKHKLTKPSRSGNLILKFEAAADEMDRANQPIRGQNGDGDRVSTAAGPIGDRGGL